MAAVRPTTTRGAWTAGIAYEMGNLVTHDNLVWQCKEDHLAVAGATPDLAPFQWRRRDAGLVGRSINGNQTVGPFLPERQTRTAGETRKYTWPTHNRHTV